MDFGVPPAPLTYMYLAHPAGAQTAFMKERATRAKEMGGNSKRSLQGQYIDEHNEGGKAVESVEKCQQRGRFHYRHVITFQIYDDVPT